MALPKLTLIAVAALVWLGACASFPGLEAGSALPPSDAPVMLLPLDELLAQAGVGAANDSTAADLAARAARLRARANASANASAVPTQ